MKLGEINMDYIRGLFGNQDFTAYRPDDYLPDYEYRFYGTWYQLICLTIQEHINLPNPSDRFYLRHLVALSIFSLALLSFFRIIKKRFSSIIFAYSAVLILATSPRIFSHQFFNPKDAIFLSTYIFCMWSFFRFLDKRNALNVVLLALCTSFLISARVLGLLFPMIISVVLFIILITKKVQFKRVIKYAIPFSLCTILLTYLLWPILWNDPINQFLESFSVMSKYDWTGPVLLDGRVYSGDKVPWFYIPRWISVSTPLVYLIPILFGLVLLLGLICKCFIQSHFSKENLKDLSILGFALGPVVAVIILKSTLYDGWRQLHFIYPAMVYMAIYAFDFLSNHIINQARYASLILVIPVISLLYRVHPYQNVWLNDTAKTPWYSHYDLDYWGSGYLEAYKRFDQRNADLKGRFIRGHTYPAWECYQVMPEEWKKERPYQWNKEGIGYIVSNFRFYDHAFDFRDKKGIYQYPVDSISIEGQVIYGLFKSPADLK